MKSGLPLWFWFALAPIALGMQPLTLAFIAIATTFAVAIAMFVAWLWGPWTR